MRMHALYFWFDTFPFIFFGKQLIMGMQALWNLDLRFLFLLKKVSRFYPDFPLKVWTDHVAQLKKRNVTEQSNVQLHQRKIFLVEKNICPPTEYNTHSSAYFILYCCTMQSYIKCVTRVPCIKLYKMYVCAPGMQVCARLHRSHNNQMWFRDPHVQITILQGTTMQSCTGCNTKERHQRRLLLRGEVLLAPL